MNNKEIIDLANKYMTPNYSRQPIAIVKGKGSSVWDADGKKYLDFVGGLAVSNLGHCFSTVNKAVQKQVGKLVHTSNLYYTEPQALLAEALVEKMYKGKFFFCNSGTEANEAALKLARRYSIDKYDKKKTEIIAFEGAFPWPNHGCVVSDSRQEIQGQVWRDASGCQACSIWRSGCCRKGN